MVFNYVFNFTGSSWVFMRFDGTTLTHSGSIPPDNVISFPFLIEDAVLLSGVVYSDTFGITFGGSPTFGCHE